jgi:signal recognition particle receptor subunit beta
MVVYNFSGEEIQAKIVYYGPALSGKTTNLEVIYARMPAHTRGKMVSMRTRTDRTLFFDYLPLDLGEISGFKTRILLYTVPGQVYYNATRKLVLKDVDAVVFVADSAKDKVMENQESLRNLEENLNELGLSLDSIPWVMQYNKRDLPERVPVEEMQKQLNLLGVPHYEACALNGDGVYETLQGVASLLYKKLKKEMDERRQSPAEGAGTPDGDVWEEWSNEGFEPLVRAPGAPGEGLDPDKEEVLRALEEAESPEPAPRPRDMETARPAAGADAQRGRLDSPEADSLGPIENEKREEGLGPVSGVHSPDEAEGRHSSFEEYGHLVDLGSHPATPPAEPDPSPRRVEVERDAPRLTNEEETGAGGEEWTEEGIAIMEQPPPRRTEPPPPPPRPVQAEAPEQPPSSEKVIEVPVTLDPEEASGTIDVHLVIRVRVRPPEKAL